MSATLTAQAATRPGTREPVGIAIDTTFDDTSVAILRGRRELLANLTLSQYRDHAEFGGVVPERASRKHLEVIHPLLARALAQAGLGFGDLDYVAVSNLPGLLGSILVGLSVAKTLAYALGKPLIGINHIEAHPYANFLVHGELPFPLVHLVAAGGHTLLIHQHEHFRWEVIGRSVDDAAGECVDKVAKLFGHAMPGGPAVDALAMTHRPGPYAFPRPLLNDPGLDFSFSGLKTALLYFRRGQTGPIEEGPVLAAFFEAVVEVLVTKTLRAARRQGVSAVTVSGGLAASRRLRLAFERACAEAGLTLYYPPPALCTDNAAMVACLAAYRHAAGLHDDLALDGYANLSV
ncbi:MAG: tRNA (adenosine(37)-N6)-threonylcarbamoyltransferase complex transferase subunit TsaD [Candidatus Lambdaproteobacteria bacterium]|nr:tRNA (adenosine(37)-N6)-threonylcarbamoyltransferase complex transferase subunit TsaD [Candidatus Lambdaproteobacteria bacterium]